MPLADTRVKKAKPAEKDYKLSDEKGLYLLAKSNGRKYWRLKYRLGGKEKLLAIGVYPDVSLKALDVLKVQAQSPKVVAGDFRKAK